MNLADGGRGTTVAGSHDWQHDNHLSKSVANLLGRLRPIVGPLLVLSYGIAALAANWPDFPGNTSEMRQGDLTFVVWALEWFPQALIHHRNPFITDFLNYPAGINMVNAGGEPLLALLLAPVTLLFGPLPSFNLLIWSVFPVSAAAMYFAAKRLGATRLGAYAAGWLYGFSPYMMGQGQQHLVLTFVPFPPLIFLVAYRLLVRQEGRPVVLGAVLGGLWVCEYFVSLEVLVTSSMLLVLSVLLLAITRRRAVRPRLPFAIKGVATACLVLVACTAYPTVVGLKGPQHTSGSLARGLSADLAGLIVPTGAMRMTTPALASKGDGLLSQAAIPVSFDAPENGSYLGMPLLLLIALLLYLRRRNLWVWFCAAMAAVATILSLGPRLFVYGHNTGVPLPGTLLLKMPVIADIGEARLALYATMFTGFLIAAATIGVSRTSVMRGPKWRRVVAMSAVSLLSVASAISWLPRWPYPVGPAAIPRYFADKGYRAIPPDSVVLVSPYPSVESLLPQFWQGIAQLRFKIIGGYGLYPSPGGTDPFPAQLSPTDVTDYLWEEGVGAIPWPPEKLPSSLVIAADFRRYVARYRVQTIVSSNLAASPAVLDDFFRSLLGAPQYSDGQLDVWYNVDERLSKT